MRLAAVQFELVSPTSAAAQWSLSRYFDELTGLFKEGFDPGLSLGTDPSEFEAPKGLFLVALVEGRSVGCGGVKLVTPEIGYIKRMWIDPSMRGVGLGRRLLSALEHHAAGIGCTSVQLESNRSLDTALRLYRSAGYIEVDPFNDEFYAHHWFTKRLF